MTMATMTWKYSDLYKGFRSVSFAMLSSRWSGMPIAK